MLGIFDVIIAQVDVNTQIVKTEKENSRNNKITPAV